MAFATPSRRGTTRQSLGLQISDVFENDGSEAYAAETEVMKETIVADIMNSVFVFGEIKLGPNPLR